jgi:hypothetical protein
VVLLHSVYQVEQLRHLLCLLVVDEDLYSGVVRNSLVRGMVLLYLLEHDLKLLLSEVRLF